MNNKLIFIIKYSLIILILLIGGAAGSSYTAIGLAFFYLFFVSQYLLKDFLGTTKKDHIIISSTYTFLIALTIIMILHVSTLFFRVLRELDQFSVNNGALYVMAVVIVLREIYRVSPLGKSIKFIFPGIAAIVFISLAVFLRDYALIDLISAAAFFAFTAILSFRKAFLSIQILIADF